MSGVLALSWLLVLVSATGAEATPGDLDPSFGGDGWVVKAADGVNAAAVLIQPDQRILVAGSLGDQLAAWRFLSNGEPDLSFGGDGEASAMFTGRGGGALAAALQPDGRIILAGYTGARMAVARLLPDGSPDPEFGEGDGKTEIAFSGRRTFTRAVDVELLPDGRLLLGGVISRGRYGEGRASALSLLTSKGALDPSFGAGGKLRTRMRFGDMTFDGQKVVLGGKDRQRYSRFFVARYGLDGAPDATFGGDGVRLRSLGRKASVYDVTEVVVDEVGRIVMSIRGATRRCKPGFGAIVRLTADGGWDASFSGDGVVPRRCVPAGAVVIQGDGRIVVAGEVFAGGGSGEYHPVVTRIQGDGVLDPTFGDGGSVRSTPSPEFWSFGSDVALQQDGKIVLLADAVYQQSFALARLFAA